MNHKPLHSKLHRNAADTKTINVDGIPEPMARAIAAMVALLRKPQRAKRVHARNRAVLPVRQGTILGKLTRDDIYGDTR